MNNYKSKIEKNKSKLYKALTLANILATCIFLYGAIALIAEPYRFATDDSLVYYQIAKNIISGKGLVFGADIPTNGFHPFWLLICTAIAEVVRNGEVFIRVISILNLALIGFTLIIVRIGFAYRIRGVYLCCGIILSMPYILYAGFGMETPLAILCEISALYFATKFLKSKEQNSLIVFSIFCGLTVFSRLDMAIVLAPMVLFIMASFLMTKYKNKTLSWYLGYVAVMSFIIIAPTIMWLGFNQIYFSNPMPISGYLKLLNSEHAHGLLAFFTGANYLQLAIIIIASSVIVLNNKYYETNRVILFACVGQFIYLAFLFLTKQKEVYSWYFIPLSITAGLAFSVGIQIIENILTDSRIKLKWQKFSKTGIVAFVVVLGIHSLIQTNMYVNRSGLSWEDIEVGVSSAKAKGVKRVLAFDRPGQLAYLNGFEVIAVDGLTTNIDFQRKLKNSGLDWLLSNYNIDAFVGPREGAPWIPELCQGGLYLNVMRFECTGQRFTKVTLFSRIDGSELGTINLTTAQRINLSPQRIMTIYILGLRKQ